MEIAYYNLTDVDRKDTQLTGEDGKVAGLPEPWISVSALSGNQTFHIMKVVGMARNRFFFWTK